MRGTRLARRPKSPTRRGLLPEARHVVLPEGIVSSGFPRVRETCRSIGITFDPWQEDLNRCLLAKTADGLYAADTAVLSIARQVGKTFDVGAVVFAECIAVPHTTVVWTAHRFKVARESFNELRSLAKSPKLVPHLDYDAITTAAGNETIPFRNGSRIVFAARERGAIRGFSKVRILVLDEAQILTEAVLSDLAPTMNQAENPLLVLMGTPPKPTDPSEVFTSLRSEALAGTAEGVLYVEMSADADADPDDRQAWRQANPSYPGRTPARAIQRLRKLLSVEDFRREALGIWDEDRGARALNQAKWAQAADPKAERGAHPAFGVDIAEDRLASVAVAWIHGDDVHVMLADAGLAPLRLEERTKELRARWGGLTYTGGTAADLDNAETVTGAQFAAACGRLEDLLESGRLRHGNQPELNAAVEAARWRPYGQDGGKAFRLKGCPEVGPLAAVARAVHGLFDVRPSDFYEI